MGYDTHKGEKQDVDKKKLQAALDDRIKLQPQVGNWG